MFDAERITWKNLLEENEQEVPGVDNLSRAAVAALVYDDLERLLPTTVTIDLRKGIKKQMAAIREELNVEGFIDRGILAVQGEGPLRFAVAVARPEETSGEPGGNKQNRGIVKTTMPLDKALVKAQEIGGVVVPEVDWGGKPRRFLTQKQIEERGWSWRQS